MPADVQTASSESQARRLENIYEQLAGLLGQPAIAQRLRIAPGQQEWSALQVMGHMAEMIPYWMHHCELLIAAAEPPHFGRTLDAPERLAGVEQVATSEPRELLHRLEAEVQTAASAIRQMSADERGRKGFHLRRGEMTVSEVVEALIVAHAEEHLAQIRAALQA